MVGDQPFSSAIGIMAIEIAMRSIMQMYTARTVIKTSQREPAGDVGEPVLGSGVSIKNTVGQESSATVEDVSPSNTLFLSGAFGAVRCIPRGDWASISLPAQKQKRRPKAPCLCSVAD
jgi:hypothetical protein